jgi:hypothetical protein
VLAEWHLTPEYILENWTDELFELMWDKRNERMLAIESSIAAARGESPTAGRNYVVPQVAKEISDVEMFSKLGIGSA